MMPLLIAIAITVLDQVSKSLVESFFALGESREVIPGLFSLTYLRNPGAAWGILSNYTAHLTALSLVMLGLIFYFRRSFLTNSWEHRVALGLMVGGIIGNLIDRVKLGYVVDFFDFYIGQSHWPVFNIADSAICVGVGMYLLSSLWLNSHPLRENNGEADMAEYSHGPGSR